MDRAVQQTCNTHVDELRYGVERVQVPVALSNGYIFLVRLRQHWPYPLQSPYHTNSSSSRATNQTTTSLHARASYFRYQKTHHLCPSHQHQGTFLVADPPSALASDSSRKQNNMCYKWWIKDSCRHVSKGEQGFVKCQENVDCAEQRLHWSG